MIGGLEVDVDGADVLDNGLADVPTLGADGATEAPGVLGITGATGATSIGAPGPASGGMGGDGSATTSSPPTPDKPLREGTGPESSAGTLGGRFVCTSFPPTPARAPSAGRALGGGVRVNTGGVVFNSSPPTPDKWLTRTTRVPEVSAAAPSWDSLPAVPFMLSIDGDAFPETSEAAKATMSRFSLRVDSTTASTADFFSDSKPSPRRMMSINSCARSTLSMMPFFALVTEMTLSR